MLQPPSRAPNDRRSAAAEPSPKTPAAASAAGSDGSALGARVRSLSLARLPERQSRWQSVAGWIAAIVVTAAGLWYGYTKYLAPRPTEEQILAAASKTFPAASKDAANKNTPSKSTAPSRSPDTSAVRPATHASAANASMLPAAPTKGEVALEAKGYIVPAHQILVSPKVSGMIVQLNVEEGRRVNKGEVLAVLETIDYAADVERAKASVGLMEAKLSELKNGNRAEEILEAQADLQEAEATVPQLEAEYKRNIELRRRSSATQQEYEVSESKYLAQLKRVERLRLAAKLMQLGPRAERIGAAEAELLQARAELAKAEWRLGNCTIRAPITGTILKKNAEEGNIVNPIAFNGSYSLCDMADLSDLEVDLNVQERDISVIQVGQKCRVRVEAYPNRIYNGYVDRLMPIADRAKGAVPVRVKVSIPAEEEGVYLKPEMGAIVTFLNQAPAGPTVLTHESHPLPISESAAAVGSP